MKTILVLLCWLAFPLGLFAQGQVNFQNAFATQFTTNGGPITGVNAYQIGLYIAPAGTTTPSLFTLAGVATNSALFPGRISYPGGMFAIPGNTGTPIVFQIRAWSLFAGNTYEEAASYPGPAYGGTSGIGQITPAIGGIPPQTLFSSTLGVAEHPGQLTEGVVLVMFPRLVPEPSTYALAVLGILMIFCCRKGTREK